VRRGSIVQLAALAALVAGGVTAVALVIPWLPSAASKERDRIDFVFWFTTGIAIFIFSIVASLSIYAVIKFRARPDDDTDGPPIHGHTGLEIFWTAVPAALVTAIAIVSGVVLTENGRAGRDPLRVEVIAQQFAWSFSYENDVARGITSPILYLPEGRHVQLLITSKDVLHSFWVPEFGQKQDAVPGAINKLVITPNKRSPKAGFPVVCTELCGLGHALMRSASIVLTPSEFAAWARKQKGGGAPTPSGGGGNTGASVFKAQGCASCHTFKPAAAAGKIGPDLDKLSQYAKRAGKPLDQFVRESIVNPEAYIEPGFPKGVMPKTFASLPKTQLDALVSYLTKGTK
jgi:cytochrome c oxidase subunit 2